MSQARKLAEIPDPGAAASAALVATLLFNYPDGRPVASVDTPQSSPRAFLYGYLVTLGQGIGKDVLLALKRKSLWACIQPRATVGSMHRACPMIIEQPASISWPVAVG